MILGDTEKYNLGNLVLMIGKQIIYQKRGRWNAYSMVHFERLVDLERKSEEILALQSDGLEIYEQKWEKYKTKYIWYDLH